MKVNATRVPAPPQFVPIKLEITLETAREAAIFRALCNTLAESVSSYASGVCNTTIPPEDVRRMQHGLADGVPYEVYGEVRG